MSHSPEETSAILYRLAQKPGVQSILILSRSNGAIVEKSGFAATQQPKIDTNGASGSSDGQQEGGKEDVHRRRDGPRNAEEIARLVWSFFGAAGGVVDEMMGTEDEVKLLRLRTKRNELVIVPDANFLLVLIHESPPA